MHVEASGTVLQKLGAPATADEKVTPVAAGGSGDGDAFVASDREASPSKRVGGTAVSSVRSQSASRDGAGGEACWPLLNSLKLIQKVYQVCVCVCVRARSRVFGECGIGHAGQDQS